MSHAQGFSGLPVYLMYWFQNRKASKTKTSSTLFTFPTPPSPDSNIAIVDHSSNDKEVMKKHEKGMEMGMKAINTLLLSVVGQPRSNLETKKQPLTDDYLISQTVLGLGINGKVVEVANKNDGKKYALKVLKDNVKSRREVELHWRSSSCKHIVNIKDVYENAQKGQKCLLVVMEWYVASI